MSITAAPARFFADLASFTNFAEITNDEHFSRLPEDWFVVITDVRGSTRAIEEGRYRDVNTIGAASISAVQEAVTEELPFVFGGDGATILVPPSHLHTTLEALSGLAALSRERYGMELRVGRVEAREVYAEGATIEVAKHEIVAGRSLAVIRGGGLAIAERLIKGDEARYCRDTRHSLPTEVRGLTCRWQPIESQRGEMMSLLVEARGEKPNDVYAEVLAKLADVFGGELDTANPVEPERMRYKSFLNIARDERRQMPRLSWSTVYARLFSIVVAILFFTFRLKLAGYDPEPYRAAMRSHADYRKFDDMLRMVVDCTDEQKTRIREVLDEMASRGLIVYGAHASETALMTCYVREMRDGQHIHFIDGGGGGYAMAAKQLKAQRSG
jgi:hypothetical protein